MTDNLNNIVPSFEETIHFPPVIFISLNDFLRRYYDIIGGTGPVPTEFETIMSMHTGLINITNLIIRYAERTTSIMDTDPSISISELLTRYNNLVILHQRAEEISELTIKLLTCLDTGFVPTLTPEGLDTLIENIDIDSTRLRTAGNVLVRSIRLAERTLVRENPNFTCLPELWFEN